MCLLIPHCACKKRLLVCLVEVLLGSCLVPCAVRSSFRGPTSLADGHPADVHPHPPQSLLQFPMMVSK
eukprot:9105745-Alexandrium_andersonii.AAC.1